METKPVFISYSHQNLSIVTRLKRDLRDRNIPFWVDHESLQPGTPNWRQSVEYGIQSSQAVIYIASVQAKQSTLIHPLLVQYGQYLVYG